MTKKGILIAAAIAVVLVTAVILLVVLLPKAPDDDVTNHRLVLSESTKTVYRVGDTFVPPTVVLIYESGQTENVSSSEFLTVSGYDMQKKGSYTVHVSYECGDVKASKDYRIEVLSNVVTDLSVTCRQDSLLWGEKIDKSNITVTATYDDGRKTAVEEYSLTYNNEPEHYGPIDAKVSYEGIEKTFTIEVVGEELAPEYKALEDEAKRILTALGIVDPSAPRDYSLEFTLAGKAKVKFFCDFDESLTEQQVLAYVSGLLADYTTDGNLVDTKEMIFPSKKIVFVHTDKQLQTSAYATRLGSQTKYSMVIEELPTEA